MKKKIIASLLTVAGIVFGYSAIAQTSPNFFLLQNNNVHVISPSWNLTDVNGNKFVTSTSGGSGTLSTTTPFTAGNLTLASTTSALSTYAGASCGAGTAIQVFSASGTVSCVSVTASGGSGTIVTSSAVIANQIPYWVSFNSLNGTSSLTFFPATGALNVSGTISQNGTAVVLQNRTINGDGLYITGGGDLSANRTLTFVNQGFVTAASSVTWSALQTFNATSVFAGNVSTTVASALGLFNSSGILTAYTQQSCGANTAVQVINANGTVTCLSVPTNTNQLTNGAGFITAAPATSTIQVSTTTITGPAFIFTTSTKANTFTITASGTTGFTWIIPPANDQYFAPTTTIPTNTNQLTNGAGFITSANPTGVTTSSPIFINAIPFFIGANASSVIQTNSGLTFVSSTGVFSAPSATFSGNVTSTNLSITALSGILAASSSNNGQVFAVTIGGGLQFVNGVLSSTITAGGGGGGITNTAKDGQLMFANLAGNATGSTLFTVSTSTGVLSVSSSSLTNVSGTNLTESGFIQLTASNLFDAGGNKYSTSTQTSALLIGAAGPSIAGYAGTGPCGAGQFMITLSASGVQTCSAALTVQSTPTSSAWVDGQILFGQKGNTATSSIQLTQTTSTGVTAIASGTVSGVLSVGTVNLSSTLNGTANTFLVSGTSTLNGNTYVGSSTVYQLYAQSSNAKSYVTAGTSTFNAAAAIGGTLAWSTTSTGNGAAASTSIATYTVPTSTFQVVGDELDVFAGGTFASTAATNKQVQFIVSSTPVFDTGTSFAPANTACNWFLESRGTMITVTSTQWVSQYTDSCQNALTDDSGDAGNATKVSFNVNSSTPITIYGNGTNASDVVDNYFRVVWAPAP